MTELRFYIGQDADRRWAAEVMSSSEPWISLRRGFDACLRACESDIDTLHIATAAGQRCGLILVRERGVAGAPYLVSIAVDVAFRSQGIGAEMLAYAESLFRGRYRHFFLCVSSFNPRAQAFYRRHGYGVVGQFRDFIVDGLDEVLMVKRL